MKRLFISCVCVIWCVHAVHANTVRSILPLKKSTATSSDNIPWQDVSERAAGLMQKMLEKPTVTARGPSETFTCAPEQYYWLLDNPDRVVSAWRRLGAKCVSITKRGPGRFGYTDEMGSDISWETLHQTSGIRIWYAEGKVKPGAALPAVPVKALVILRHVEGKTPDGSVIMQHQSEIVIHTDSKAAAAVTKMMGQSATRLAEQGLGQLQLFFSALSSYVDRHPDQVDLLFRPEKAQTIQPAQHNSK